MRFTFRQWRVFHCLRRFIVIFGARRTGKSYVTNHLSVKYLLKGIDVIHLNSTTRMGEFSFSGIGTILRNIRGLKKYLGINYAFHSITYGENNIRFAIDINLEDVVRTYHKNKPCVIFADEIYDIPQLIFKIFYLERKYNVRFKKIIITGTPVNSRCNKKHIKSINNIAKVFTWKRKVL